MPGASDGAALLRAIIDNPDEDTPRLVYADWLDEQGDEANAARAEFIRVQVAEHAKCEAPGRRAITPRERELLDRWGAAWGAELPHLTGITWVFPHYERGFLQRVAASSVLSLLKAAPEVFARAPVTWLGLDRLTARTAKRLAGSPVLARFRRFDKLALSPWEPGALAPLAHSPHLGNLREIDLFQPGFDAPGFRLLLGSSSLTRLARLSVRSWELLGAASVAAVLGASSAPVIEEVTLQGCGIGPGAAPRLPELVGLPALKRLFLTGNQIDDAAAEELSRAKAPRPLTVGLAYNAITNSGARALLEGEFLRGPGVRLHLDGNPISAGMKAALKEEFGARVTV